MGACILIALGVAIYAAWEGWLGQDAQSRARLLIEPLLSRLPHQDLLDRLVRVLGATGTALTAAFGVYKGIYYADRNLPERLRQLLARTNERLLNGREALLAAVTEPRAGERVKGSVFFVAPLNRAIGDIGLGRFPTAEASLTQALCELEEQIQVSHAQMRSIEEQRIVAHVLRGSIASARAEYNSGSRPPDLDRQLAEDEFSKALEIRAADIDALELRGRQRELRGNHKGALEDYEALNGAANGIGKWLRAARACRLQAELLEKGSRKQDIDTARARLASALQAMNAVGSLKQADWLEKGLVHKAFGRVQISRRRLPDARAHLRQAMNCFGQVKTQEGRDHALEAGDLLKTITPSPNIASTGLPTADRKKWYQRLFG